jgi:hypothetical protein
MAEIDTAKAPPLYEAASGKSTEAVG